MNWYEDDVQGAIQRRLNCPYEPKSIFYGSSSIRLWDSLYEYFAPYKPVNLGFGGSTLAACVWFFERIVAPVSNPDRIILYAGDNDLGDGRKAEDVLYFYKEFIVKLRKHYPEIPCYYISIKPSISRFDIIEEIKKANRLLEEHINMNGEGEFFVNVYDKMLDQSGLPISALFDSDGLHLNNNGYKIWNETIRTFAFNQLTYTHAPS